MKTTSILALAASLLIILGVFLPWANMTGIVSRSVNGMEGSAGKEVLLLGISALLITLGSLVNNENPDRFVGLLLVPMGLAVWLAGDKILAVNAAIANFQNELVDNPFAALVGVQVGVGLYAILIGGITGIVAALIKIFVKSNITESQRAIREDAA